MGDTNLKKLIESTDCKGGLILNTKGELLNSFNINSGNNVAAMIAVIVTMTDELSRDVLHTGDFKQLTFRSEEGVYTICKYKNDGIICLISEDATKSGLITLALKSLTNT